MHVQAIITDLDGTALNSPTEKVVSSELAEAVDKAHKSGIKVCAATGRPLSFARPVFDSMNLKDPAIIAGGSQIVNPVTGEKLWGLDIPKEDLEKIIDMIKPLRVRALWNDYIEEEYNRDGGRDISSLNSTEGIHFFEIIYIPNKEAEKLRVELDKVEGVTAVLVTADKPGMNDIHIVNKAATKEHAVYELEKLINVTKTGTVGVGDGPNDIHLFNAVGIKIAMGNAVEELKSVADRVIKDVKEDGLAEFIREIVSNGGEL